MDIPNKDAIPQSVVDFAKELGELCSKHELINFRGKIDGSFQEPWYGGTDFSWDSGRHGAAEGIIKLSTTINVGVECPIDYKDKLSYLKQKKGGE